MTFSFRSTLCALALATASAVASLAPGAVQAQNIFEAVIKVNDQAITRYEIEQRARMAAAPRRRKPIAKAVQTVSAANDSTRKK